MRVRPRSDLAAIEAAYVTGYPGYVRLAAAVSGHNDRAADMVQEAFARALRARGSFHGDGPLEGWIARIVVNVARDEARRPPVPEVELSAHSAADETPGLAPMVAAYRSASGWCCFCATTPTCPTTPSPRRWGSR
jgi:DNA-directed RNA polymerase specialized sigma24 family protein